jgi:poly(ADP-ribose) glycohydrolase
MSAKERLFPLPNYTNSNWEYAKSHLESKSCTSLDNVYSILCNFIKKKEHREEDEDRLQFKTLNAIGHFYDIFLIEQVRQMALELPIHFPSGFIRRLEEAPTSLEFTRVQVLCLLCHMFFCTLQRTESNLYWTTFENWLCDGRICATTYLRTLLEYFQQSFNGDTFRGDETIEFKRVVCTEMVFTDKTEKICQIDLRLSGSIGDESTSFVEVDFANRDIGYGVTGTQEEILFGSSPEMCIAMLFCDTMRDNEAIVIRGARRVAAFLGYGTTLCFDKLVPSDSRNWNQRYVVAIDAADYSHENDLKSILLSQISEKSLHRELKKAYAGFCGLPQASTIQTGHWGCGAFCGNQQIKALVQLVAASLASGSEMHKIVFFCFEDKSFYESFTFLISFLRRNEVSICDLWIVLSSMLEQAAISDFDEKFSAFDYLIGRLDRNGT